MLSLNAVMDIPHFPTDLIDPVLAFAIRHLRQFRSTIAGIKVAPILNVLPRNLSTHANYAAILRMPWIDTDLACRLADFWLLDVLHNRLTRPPYSRPLQYKLPDALVTASEQGRLDVLQWWIDQRLPVTSDDPALFLAASKGGHVDVLDFWSAIRTGMRLRYRPLTTSACIDIACRNGHARAIEWCSQNASVSMIGIGTLAPVCVAVDGGHHEVVSWYLKDSGFGLDQEAKATLLIVAILTKQPAIVDLLLHQHDFALTPVAASFACITGSISTLTRCTSLVPPSATSTKRIDAPVAFLLASAAGSLDLLNHLKDSLDLEPGLIMNQQDEFFNILRILLQLPTFARILAALETWFDWSELELLPADVASLAGHAHVLDWLAEYHGSGLDYAQCAAISAATHGHLPVIQWWIEKHVDGVYRWPMSAELVDKACANGHLAIVQCLWEASKSFWSVRFEYSRGSAVPALAEHGRVEFAQWWIANVGKPGVKEIQRAVAQACKYGQVEFLKMMVDCRLLASADDIAQDAIASAAKRGHVSILEWWAAEKQRTICRSWLDPQAWPAAYDVVAWILDSGLPVVDLVEQESRTETEWFVIERDTPSVGLLRAVHEAKTLYLDLCLDSAIVGKQVASFDLSAASMSGQIAVLDWAVARGNQGELRLEYSWDLVLKATQSRAYHVLDWWLTRSGLELSVSAEGLGRAIGDDEVMREWWRKTGFVSEEELKWDAEQEQVGWGW